MAPENAPVLPELLQAVSMMVPIPQTEEGKTYMYAAKVGLSVKR